MAAFSSFGPSYSLCWLTSVPMQFYAFFIPVMICLAFTITILVRLARVAHHRYASRLPTVYHGDFFRRIARGLELHFSFLAFVGVYPYAFRIASRAYIWRHGRQQPILAFLEYFTIAFRGPLVRPCVRPCVCRCVLRTGGETTWPVCGPERPRWAHPFPQPQPHTRARQFHRTRWPTCPRTPSWASTAP